MSRVFYGSPDFPRDEFHRAMFSPEVERERSELSRSLGSARSELEHVRRIISFDRAPRRFGVRMEFDTDMLACMAGNMDQVKEMIWSRLEDELTGLFRATRRN